MWRETLEFGEKFCLFVHKNTIQIGENWACFPGNKHFFIMWSLILVLCLGFALCQYGLLMMTKLNKLLVYGK